MRSGIQFEKGGRDAAFFLFLFAVAVLGFGGSVQYPLAALRAGAFGAAVLFLWRRKKEPLRPTVYALLVGSFVLVAIGHAFSSVYFWVSFQHAVNIALAAVFLGWAVRLFRRDPDKMWNTAVAMVGTLAVVEVGIALFQRFHGGELRPAGTFDNADYLAEFLVAASLLWFSTLLGKGGSYRLRILGGAGVLAVLAAAFSLAGSRGVLVASVPALAVVLVSRFGMRKGGVLLAGAGIPALGFVGMRAAMRFFSGDVYNYSRWIIWKSALRTFLDHPFGVGLGGFKYYWFATRTPVEGAFSRFGRHATTAHSEYLEVLSGLGAIGFLLFLAVLVVPLILTIRRRNEIPPQRQPAAAGAAGVLVLSGVNALFNPNFHVFGIFVLDAILLGALLSVLPERPSRVFALPGWARTVGIIGCTMLVAATVSTAGGVWAFDRGEQLLKAGNLPAAERAFHRAAAVDSFRAAYPDAVSAIAYRRYASKRRLSAPASDAAGAVLDESIRWESRAASLAPRELKFLQRLSFLFVERFRARGRPADMEIALTLASRSLEIDPFSTEALLSRSALFAEVGRPDAAKRDLERAVTLEPNFCRGYAKLAGMSKRNDPSKSAEWAGKADACRKRAAGVALEEYEKWLVEDPGK